MAKERMSNLEEPAWFGVTIGAQPFLIKARNSGEVVEMICQYFTESGVLVNELDFARSFARATVHRHPDELQASIDEKYPDETVVRVKPFTTERW